VIRPRGITCLMRYRLVTSTALLAAALAMAACGTSQTGPHFGSGSSAGSRRLPDQTHSGGSRSTAVKIQSSILRPAHTDGTAIPVASVYGSAAIASPRVAFGSGRYR
jgi:hypothetical protein